jgi:hypothetical protein
MAEEMLSTDDEILNAIGEGGTSEDTEESSSSSEQTAQEVIETAQENKSGQVIEQGTESESREQQTRGPQDLVDAQGNVIASGGKERRFYEQAQRFRQEAATSNNRVQELEGQLKAINDAGNAGTQYNLTPEEVTTGVQLMAAFKENPVETVKYMLTQAQSLGHNIDGITSSSTDMASIKKMLNEAINPLVQDRQERIEGEQSRKESRIVYDNFMTKFPDAKPHEHSLARLLESDQSLSPEAAYFKLKNFYLEKNLDFNKPLEVLQQELDAQKQAPVERNTQSTVPTGGVPAANVTDTETIADVGTSMDDIIKQSMRDAGMNYN